MTIYYADNSQFTKQCGDQMPETYELPAAGLNIKFKSDTSNERKGFRLRYQSLGNGNNIKNNGPHLQNFLKLRCIQGDWLISSGGERCGRWADAFGNAAVAKHVTHPFFSNQNTSVH